MENVASTIWLIVQILTGTALAMVLLLIVGALISALISALVDNLRRKPKQ